MKNDVRKAYKTNLLKVYGLVYSLVAAPVAYYGLLYISLFKDHIAAALLLFGAVMTMSVILNTFMQRATNRKIYLFLDGKTLPAEDLLVLACAILSTPMTYFISEHTAGKFLSLADVRNIPEPDDVKRLSLRAKIMIVSLIIILTLILYSAISTILSINQKLSQTETVINQLVISIVGVLGTLITSLLLARSLKVPITNMAECTGIIQQGDLSAASPPDK